jgi:hypothetical protein
MPDHLSSASVLVCTVLGLSSLTGASPVPLLDVEPKKVTVVGDGPVIQVLPGPFRFADSAAPILAKMPSEKREMTKQMARNGPFSDRVAEISGTFRGSFWDAGARGDSVAAAASFTSQDGAQWQVKVNRVAPEDESPMDPHFGGVATEIAYHGATGIHTPLVPSVRSVVSFWGMSEVTRNGKLVTDQGPTHVMFTSDARGDDFAYQCWNCTDRPVRQLHLMLMPPEGKPYEVPGGILHIMWEDSKYRVSNTSG